MMNRILICLFYIAPFLCFGSAADPYLQTSSGKGDSCPEDYVPPFLGNGSISTSIDYLGKQIQKRYVTFFPEIVWAGRRYPPTVHNSMLITMGHFDDEVSVDGKPLGKPLSWKQSLNTREACSIVEVEYEDATVITIAFVPYGLDMFVVRKSVLPKSKDAKTVDLKFTYFFTDLNSGKAPSRVLVSPRRDDAYSNAAAFDYTAYAYKVYNGEVSLISDAPASVSLGKLSATLSSKFDLSKAPAAASYFISFADDFQQDKAKRSSELKNAVVKKGFDGIFSEHKAKWADFWKGSYIEIPDKKMHDAYATALYHLKSMSTKWSIPVSLFGHGVGWSGRFFGWDEMFCVFGAASSGKFDISVRTANFRKNTLKNAMNRVGHYSKYEEKKFGARYPWESLEDAAEGAPNPYGFWFDHVFHMSNIAASAWIHYLFTGDKNFLEKTAYPVIRECAAFFYSHMLQKDGDRLIIGKCTDIERLGPAVENPFLTSCGAIYNFEVAARAADILGVDSEYAAKLRHAAKELRKTLPSTPEMYVPFDGCTEKSIVAIGGFYPYEIFDKSEKKQVAAVYDFMKNISSAGNMYPVGNSVCSWYAAWLSSALVIVGDNVGPGQMLSKTARNTGQFAETWEINEPDTRHTPWFTTSAGNYVYAVNQILVSPRENGDINVAAGVPVEWSDYAFKLPVFGGGWIDAKISGGKFAKLEYKAGSDDSVERRLILPKRLLPDSKISPDWKLVGENYVVPVGKSFSL